tara:strand:+ start:1630 stop:2091 length:462 start_codon:yes stop_codon:yes gene_type:complete
MIVEMAGRPANHVKESLSKHVGVLDKLGDLTVHKTTVSEPKEMEKSKDSKEIEPVFTCFAEVDFETETFSRMTQVMFDFMPSSVEVIEPAKVSLESAEATELLNNLSGRLHRYDEVARVAQFKANHLEGQLKSLQEPKLEEDSEKPKKKPAKK